MSGHEGWRSRIKEITHEDPKALMAHPENWRAHPPGQRKRMSAALNEVGWLDGVIVNDVTGHILDGHMRVEIAVDRGEATVPVTHVELSAEEERIAVATYDPLGALALQSHDRYAALAGSLSVKDETLAGFLEDLVEGRVAALPPAPDADGTDGGETGGSAAPSPPAEFAEYGEDIETHYECPRCSYRWSGKANRGPAGGAEDDAVDGSTEE